MSKRFRPEGNLFRTAAGDHHLRGETPSGGAFGILRGMAAPALDDVSNTRADPGVTGKD